MTAPHTPPAAPDVAAAPNARDNLRRVRAMYDAAPPEGCDDGNRSPALERVAALLAHGHSMHYLDARDVRCLVVVVDDAEQIIDSLQGQAALLSGEVAAAVAEEREACARLCEEDAHRSDADAAEDEEDGDDPSLPRRSAYAARQLADAIRERSAIAAPTGGGE